MGSWCVGLPVYEFQWTDMLWAVVIGVVAALGAMLFVAFGRLSRRLSAVFGERHVLRGTTAGVALGLLGMALPLTLFNGANGLVAITTPAAVLTIGVIVVSAICKLAATSGALAFGFVGGPIFPAMFAGGAFGVMLHELFPSLPLAPAVAGGVAALPGCIVDVPFAVAILAMLIVGPSPFAAAPVITSVVVALILVRGFGLLALVAGPVREAAHE